MANTEGWSDGVRDKGSEPQRRFVLSYRPVIAQIAYQVASGLPPAVDLNDLISDGTIGLIKAIGTFDPSRQVKFSSYAEGRIRGAILDGLRSLDWMPRSLRRDLKRLERTRLDLQQRHGRPATSEELAREMDFSLEELRDLLSAAVPAAVQGNRIAKDRSGTVTPEDLPDSEGADPHASFIKKEIRSLLEKALEGLQAKERAVIGLYYFGELNLKQIGTRLSVSESRICQIHGRAMRRIRKILLRRLSRAKAYGSTLETQRLLKAS